MDKNPVFGDKCAKFAKIKVYKPFFLDLQEMFWSQKNLQNLFSTQN
jgi:hypothetical protein